MLRYVCIYHNVELRIEHYSNINQKNIIYADDTALYSKCDQITNLWQQIELVCELESDLRDNVDWGKK